MAIADFTFYQDTFKGVAIKSEEEYAYPAERAGDELARFVDFIPKDEAAQNLLKRCACAIADIKFNVEKSSKNGNPITSESVNGYYSVSYGAATGAEAYNAEAARIRSLIIMYLGRYIQRSLKAMI